MAFTAGEVANIANATLEYHFETPRVRSQTLQDKPLLQKMKPATKTFPGGNQNIEGRVKGVYSGNFQGFEHDDTVSYVNPANINKWVVPWKLVHGGLSFTMHEMAIGGISMTETETGKSEVRHSRQERVRLVDLLTDKVEDMMESYDRGMNQMLWQDGTQDVKLAAGVKYFIVDDPTAATVVAGIDQSTNPWWRNRADVAITLGDTTGASQAIMETLDREMRQLRRYGGRPNCAFAGSDFLDRMQKELRYKGVYTQTGWADKGSIDGSVSNPAHSNIKIEYDPTLDDLGETKRCYILDSRRIFPQAIEGEQDKTHNPARPETKYVFYRAKTWMGALTCNQRNCHGVYGFA